MTALLQVLPTYDPAFGGPVSAALGVSASYEGVEGVTLTTVGCGPAGAGWTRHDTVSRRAFAPPVARHVLSVSPGLLAWVARRVRRFDLVHVHFNRGLVMIWIPLLARLARVPYVLQTHGMCRPWTGPLALVDRLFTRPAIRHAHAVFVLGAAEREQILGIVPGANVVEVHNAVRSPDAVDAGPRPGGPRLLFCARLHPRKGLDRFLDVVERLAPEHPGLEGHVVGADEGALAAARERVAAAGLPVTFHGGLDRDGVDAWMARCDVLLHPAPREPFGMSMIEAFAAGLPVVAARSSELAGVFAAEGAALLPDDGSVEDWVDATRRVLVEPATADALRVGGRAVLERHFSRASLTRTLAGVVHGA
ncbi:glycosyltransferase family 4 protein [Actinomycetospora termitidis]|uniref:Glycosyltransferase family 4 protein n=1 Tax=Actinomycetospora termitidis TaxID=3053470 RepID=A0ABT7MIM1_9PSEU|nr:glycosyltransferase family 4 protein [Actinomycetospora sp. Odt1-22]MDL5159178.1 glycosyltransferase family 4 protein [Actinomycetospora sp. Odt1-22]